MLTAIAIPVFTTQLERSREATDMSNLRAAYAEVMAEYLATGNESFTATVEAKQQVPSWQNTENGKLYVRVSGEEKEISVAAKTVKSSGVWTVGVAPSTSKLITVS